MWKCLERATSSTPSRSSDFVRPFLGGVSDCALETRGGVPFHSSDCIATQPVPKSTPRAARIPICKPQNPSLANAPLRKPKTKPTTLHVPRGCCCCCCTPFPFPPPPSPSPSFPGRSYLGIFSYAFGLGWRFLRLFPSAPPGLLPCPCEWPWCPSQSWSCPCLSWWS